MFDSNGLLSRILQHEIDHLDGILMTERNVLRQQSLAALSQPKAMDAFVEKEE